MKRFYSVACALAITFSAGSALALEKMDSKSKSDVTAQSGVTITLDNIVTDMSVDSAGYTDDGIGTGTGAGSVYVTIGNITTTTDGTLTIDAGTVTDAATADAGGLALGTSFVRLGIDEVVATVSNLNVGLFAGTATGASGSKSFGSVQVNGFQTTTNGAIFISPH